MRENRFSVYSKMLVEDDLSIEHVKSGNTVNEYRLKKRARGNNHECKMTLSSEELNTLIDLLLHIREESEE